MKKYLVILTAPSMHMMNEPYDYIKPYIIQDNGHLIDDINERLMRYFALEFKVPLKDVNILSMAAIK